MRKRGWAFWGMVVSGSVVVLAGASLWWMAGRLQPNLELASAAPAVTFESVDGRRVELASLQGKVVLLDFWSST